MGILDNIFKSLWGKKDEQADGAKPGEPDIRHEPVQSQSYSSTPVSKPETVPVARTERPVEVSVRPTPPPPAPMPTINPPEPAPQPVTVNKYSSHTVEEARFDSVDIEDIE